MYFLSTQIFALVLWFLAFCVVYGIVVATKGLLSEVTDWIKGISISEEIGYFVQWIRGIK